MMAFRAPWSFMSLSMRLHLCKRTRTSLVESVTLFTVNRPISLKVFRMVAR